MNLRFITPSKPIQCPKIWKEFSAEEIAEAKLEITGLGLYRALLNGQRIGIDYLTPGFNDYDAYLRVQTYDVTALLQARNRLEILLGDGWYMGRFGTDGGRDKRWGDRYLLAARLTMVDTQGIQHIMETDESWLAEISPIVMSNIYDGEIRDDTRLPEETVPCCIVQTPYKLENQFSPCIRVIETRKPKLIITPKGEQVLDFGQNMAGIISFVNRLPRGKTIRIQTGEVLQEGCFYRDNLRTAKSEFVYTSDGCKKEIEPLFTFHGFRYARVEGTEEIQPEDFTALALSTALTETLDCETDHEKLNQLIRNTMWGQRSNFIDVPTDCPQRDERLGWTADAQVFVNTACYQADCKLFYRKYMRDLRADQVMYYGGDIPMYSPSLKKEAGHGGAVWADAGTIIPWHVYMNYGDQILLAENYPMMRDYCQKLIDDDLKSGGTHLVFNSFTFGDWLAQDGMTPQSLKGGTEDAFIQGVYYMHSVQLTGKAAQVLGKECEAVHYADLAKEIRTALVDEYITPGGRLAIDTQTGYVLALYYGIFRDKAKLLDGFKKRLQRDFFRITCGFTGAPLMLPVLLDNGMIDEAYRMLLSERFPGWLYAINLGATTVWERWNSLNDDGSISGTGMNSLNHYAYGSVCEAVYSRIMGLANASPGWTKALIAPKIDGRIKHSRIRYASAAGVYEVRWDILEDGSITLTADIPEGAQADVILPDHPENARFAVSGGKYSYTWRPTKDYLHPFTAQTPMMDILANPEAAAILKKHAPVLYATASDLDGEFAVMSPIAISFAMPFLNPQDAFALDPMLRNVKI